MSLHLITNGKQPFVQFIEIARMIDSYIDVFHIREKHLSAKELYEGVDSLLKAGISPRKVIINDRADVAASLGVRGVQLAHHSLPIEVVRATFPNLMIGCSTHSVAEGERAEKGGASFTLFGHIFESTSKPGLQPKGCDTLKAFCAEMTIPVVAIGGITPEKVESVWQQGVSGIAVMSGILESEDPVHTARAYKEAIRRVKGGYHEKNV
ncbi:thiamine phosphate synthase [Bacillus spongiae]|uniref:Thiamine phosphate synthase n=1 Tax=Bacillus spongiae TaxID=2683610 RepID=A0ABU8HJI4_9BACI